MQGRLPVLINPGAGPVDGDTSREHAITNAQALATELGEGWRVQHVGESAEDGRWPCLLACDEIIVDVLMPGLALDRVRFDADGSDWVLPDPWPPRLYVEGSSWLWPFAIGIMRGKRESARESA